METTKLKKIINKSFFYKYLQPTIIDNISIFNFGYEKCSPTKEIHSLKNTSHNVLHYVISGNGYIVDSNNQIKFIEKNTIFIANATNHIQYYPSHNEPWTYIWINFIGNTALNYLEYIGLKTIHVHKVKNIFAINDVFYKLLTQSPEEKEMNFFSLSCLFNIFSIISLELQPNINLKNKDENGYISYVKNYINSHYEESPTIELLSKKVYLNPIYLNKLFKQNLGISIHKYIINSKIEKAYQLLNEGMNILEVSYYLGYNDIKYFSKVFKQQTGISPSKFLNKKNKL